MILRTALAVTGLLALGACATASVRRGPTYGATVSVAFDATTLLRSTANGLADPQTRRRVTPDDPVRIASVSKLVTALAVMRLVEAGTLDLDRDVSGWLGWPLRNPRFPDTPITLRMLLSHRSSLTDRADYIIPLGEAIRDRLGNVEAWDGDHPPGTYFRYTNFNFPVIATVMERATGERFDRLMDRLVFSPLRIDACMNWTTCSDAAVARAVVLTDAMGHVRRDDLKGQRPACPVIAAADGSCELTAYVPGTNGALFSPQGGVRISMIGLARIGQMVLRGGDRFLTPASIATLTGPEWHYDGSNGETEKGFDCTYGLAMQTLASSGDGCNDDPFGDGRRRIGHAGEAYGLRSGLWIDRERKRGIAFFVTAVADDAPHGRSAFTAAEEDVLRKTRNGSR